MKADRKWENVWYKPDTLWTQIIPNLGFELETNIDNKMAEYSHMYLTSICASTSKVCERSRLEN